MPAGPGGAGMPTCPFGVSVIGWTMEPRAQWSVGGTHRQHTDTPAPQLYSWTSRGQRRTTVWGCDRHPSPWPLLRAASRMHLTRRPAQRLTWQLPAVTLPTVAQNLRHLVRLPLATLFWMPWALTCPEADRPTPESGRLETTFFMPTVVPKSQVLGSCVPH